MPSIHFPTFWDLLSNNADSEGDGALTVEIDVSAAIYPKKPKKKAEKFDVTKRASLPTGQLLRYLYGHFRSEDPSDTLSAEDLKSLKAELYGRRRRPNKREAKRLRRLKASHRKSHQRPRVLPKTLPSTPKGKAV